MPVQLSENARKQLDEALDAYPQKGKPGTVVGIVNKEGQMIYLRSAGAKNAVTGEKLEDDTIFWIASCTKMITGIAAMQLVEKGLISLDEPVSKFVPELADIRVITDSTPTTLETRKANTPITLRMLLTHTSGWGYSWYNHHILNWVKQNDNEPLVNEPGTKWEYGINMDWAGITVERVSGQKLGDYFIDNIFKPLGIDDSYFDFKTRPDLLKRLSPMHKWDAELVDTPNHRGGGGLHTTAKSYLTVVSVLLNKGKGPNGVQILKPETVEYMFKDHCENIQDKGGLGTHAVVKSTDPSRANTDLEMLAGTKKGWGLSFLLNTEDIPNGRKAFSAEWGGVANLFWMADPTSQVGMIVFNEVLPYGFPEFFKMEEQLQHIVYADGGLVQE
uniref:Beta-lactamase-related domain-containing protein n=1 Tax=Kwoniella bestiolae CBS 10118 TaxID=1296100 RepID=A0A1B9G5F9_9TREE|nr:hypothetical protein I302_03938 [Kwoniella bestiolae CBS 10118]OCF26256.1 hypothetical protein I302_03938 [Kwoniella bestiolae CBS 10118]